MNNEKKTMKTITADIETNGLYGEVTTGHCVSIRDYTGSLTTYTDIREAFPVLENNNIIGHNWAAYDHMVLKKLYPEYNPKGVIIDTLLLSRMIHPHWQEHSIEKLAIRYGLPIDKVQNEDWTVLTQNMIDRCEADVEINWLVFEKMRREWDSGLWTKAMEIEVATAQNHTLQVAEGVAFDSKLAEKTLKRVDKAISWLSKTIQVNIPPTYKQKGTTVDQPMKLDGTMKKKVIDSGLPVWGAYTLVESIPINLNSHQQTKAYFLSQGWKPILFNYKKGKDGKPVYVGEGRRKKKVVTSPKLDEFMHGLSSARPAKQLKLYTSLNKRRSLIKNKKKNTGWLNKVRPDGRIEADAMTLGTYTTRYTHKTVANVPRIRTLLGKEMRSMFMAATGKVLVGADASSLEARVLVHFLKNIPGSETLVGDMLNGSLHAKNAEMFGCSIDDAKTRYYALIYGAWPDALSRDSGMSIEEAKKTFDLFWDSSTVINDLKDKLSKLYKKQGWLPAIDGRKLYPKSDKDCMNTVIQATGSIICKNSQNIFARKTVHLDCDMVVSYHDEFIVETTPELSKEVANIMMDCYTESAKELGLRVPLGSEAKIGNNWSEIH